MSDDTWDTICGYFVCFNLVSVAVTILKLFGVIGDEIPWLVATAPLIFDLLAIIIFVAALVIVVFYICIRESIHVKKSQISHKKRSLK